MLIPYTPKTSKQTYVSMNTRGGASEIQIGGIKSGSYAPTPCRNGRGRCHGRPKLPRHRQARAGKPAAASRLQSRHERRVTSWPAKHESGEPQIFNLYIGQQKLIYDADSDGRGSSQDRHRYSRRTRRPER